MTPNPQATTSITTTPKKPKPAAEPEAKGRHHGYWLVLALALVAVMAGGWWWRSRRTETAKKQAEANRKSEIQAVEVKTTRLSEGGIVRTSTQIGSVHPYEMADLFAKVSGYLADLHVNYGDRVTEGQILAEIDVPEIVADEQKARADVLQSKAAVAQAEALIVAATADAEAAQSAVAQAKAEVDRYVSSTDFHQKKLARYRDLVAKRAIPQSIADEEEEAYQAARANQAAANKAVLTAQADLAAANARIKKAEADLEQAKADVAVFEAVLARAEAMVGYTKIVSPYDGVITKRNFFPGAFIRSAAEGETLPLLTVARADMVYVVTDVPDRDVPHLDVGDPAEVTLDALPGRVFKGNVSRFADAEDPQSRTMHTEIDLPNEDDTLRPGMYGLAKIILDTESHKATLPATTLVGGTRGNKADIFIIKDGKAKKTQVTIGADDGLRVEILDGLDPKDLVILDTQSVSDGAPVQMAQSAKNPEPQAQPTETAARPAPDKQG